MNALNPEEASQELERIKHEMYHFCKEDVDEIISNGVRDPKRIQRLLDYLFVFNPDDTFIDIKLVIKEIRRIKEEKKK